MMTLIERLWAPEGAAVGGSESSSSAPTTIVETDTKGVEDTPGDDFDEDASVFDFGPVAGDGSQLPAEQAKPAGDGERSAPEATPTPEPEPDRGAKAEELRPAAEKPKAAETAKPAEEPKTEAQPKAEVAADQPSKDQTIDQQTLVQRLDAGRDVLLGKIAESYKLSEQDLTALDENPGEVLPKLAARVYFDAIRTAAATVEQIVPRMIEQVTAVRSAAKAGEDEFYGTYKGLKGHEEKVRQFAVNYRQLHPKMPRAEFMEQVAKAMGAILGVDARGEPAASGSAANGSGGPRPFQPARSSAPVPASAAARAARQNSDNMWAAMGEMMDSDLEE